MYDAWHAGSRDLLPMDDNLARKHAGMIDAKVLSNRRPPYSLAGGVFDALKDTFLSKVKAGTILRVYVDGNGQGTAATAWWNNILTGKGDPERGDIMVNGPAKWEFELTDLSIQLLTEQNGLLLVGDGYTVKKVTIE